ncbi:right-handed parallel beta-helix repeat-containing protein [Kordia sp.]|uniref:right-handed parallel beta-helix repeat-containing protein n=1 Tax=Kordia sp. TaxID=1965332 RepID=UPI003D6A78D5
MKLFCTLLIVFLCQVRLNAQIITIGDTGDYPTLNAVEDFVSPGDTLMLQSQTFTGFQSWFDISGTPSAPIVIMAEVEHQTFFTGGATAIYLHNCSNIEINGLVIEGQTVNGINIDDGGNYSTPALNITIRNCIFRDFSARNMLKMSGIDNFLIEDCEFMNTSLDFYSDAGIDFVGCHHGTVQDNYFDSSGGVGIVCKGGSQFITIRRNFIKNNTKRAINIGGGTGFQFFRPPLPDPIVDAFEAADIEVYSNVFVGSFSQVSFETSVRSKVYNNTFYNPSVWVIRILGKPNTSFLECADNEFINNIVYLENDLTEVNIGPNTQPQTFTFSNNLWYNASDANWTPILPVTDTNQIIAAPIFEDLQNENFRVNHISPAIGNGLAVSEPILDFDENPFNTSRSIGAFENRSTLSTSDFSQERIVVYPNPVSETIHIENNTSNLIDKVSLYTIDGKQIKVNYSDGVVDVSQISAGMYFFKIYVKNSSQSHIKKIVKQ